MENKIEILDDKRMLYLKWYIVGFGVAVFLLFTSYFSRLRGGLDQPLRTILLIGLYFVVCGQILFVILSALLEKEISKDPILDAALNNELVKNINLESWIAAYIATCATTLLYAISSSFYPLCDALTISLSSILMGAGAHRVYFFLRYRYL